MHDDSGTRLFQCYFELSLTIGGAREYAGRRPDGGERRGKRSRGKGWEERAMSIVRTILEKLVWIKLSLLGLWL